jgi:hypothetical protein
MNTTRIYYIRNDYSHALEHHQHALSTQKDKKLQLTRRGVGRRSVAYSVRRATPQDYLTGGCARILASRTQLSDSTSVRTLWLCRRPRFTLTNEHVWPPHPAPVAYALISTSVRSTLLEMESLLLSKFGYRRLEVAKCCNCKSATRRLITKHV